MCRTHGCKHRERPKKEYSVAQELFGVLPPWSCEKPLNHSAMWSPVHSQASATARRGLLESCSSGVLQEAPELQLTTEPSPSPTQLLAVPGSHKHPGPRHSHPHHHALWGSYHIALYCASKPSPSSWSCCWRGVPDPVLCKKAADDVRTYSLRLVRKWLHISWGIKPLAAAAATSQRARPGTLGQQQDKGDSQGQEGKGPQRT